MSRVKCNNCEERRDADDTFLVSRKVGGNYRQAARWQKCRVCSACVQRLAAGITPGHLSVDRWSKAGIEIVAERLAARQPWDECRVRFKIDDESQLADGRDAWKQPPAFLGHWRVVDVAEVNGRRAAVFHVTGSADIGAGYNVKVWLEKIGARKVAKP